MAEEVGMLSPLYRSRKLQLYIVLQMLSQLAPTLRQQIWAIGNLVCFSQENKVEAEEVARQLFAYDPQSEKLPPATQTQNPLTEPEHGQDRQIADWIQKLNFRECILKRYISERQRDRLIRHVPKTGNIPPGVPEVQLMEVK